MATDFVRTQLLHRFTTEKVKLDIANAVPLRSSDPVLATAILGSLESPLGIVLDFEQDLRSSRLEVFNGMGTVQLRESYIAIGTHRRSPSLSLVAQELSHSLR